MHRSILLIILIMIVAAPATRVVHASTVTYLDSDIPTRNIATLEPGRVYTFSMEWDVTFSSVHGDDENKDSDLQFADIRIHVGLGNDDVKIWVYQDGEEVWSKELARQHGFSLNDHRTGSIQVTIDADCDGNVAVIIDNTNVANTVIQQSTPITSDDDVRLTARGSHHCGSGDTTSIDWQEPSGGGFWASLAAAFGSAGAVAFTIIVIAIAVIIVMMILGRLGGARKLAKSALG